MLIFSQPIKFIKSDSRTITSKNDGQQYTFIEAILFIPDLGRVKVPVSDASVKLPQDGQMVNLSLSVDQGKFNSIRVLWDSSSQFKAA